MFLHIKYFFAILAPNTLFLKNDVTELERATEKSWTDQDFLVDRNGMTCGMTAVYKPHNKAN